ncbi:hypothetical protein J23TS9_05380 [Paenibacillus sp. J23TS9]|uniref:AAA family ATPase n=1 Tax=Paenibacillus sp. J23TS9 TaxID=2807193 RepID=UPI001AFF7BD1|nr:AAA family ATPase [Paenibacillus sp. J23TS9]GIP25408.1 hypothetical protein J23TS9_05380 [Paenibacillus sp. J23TS9]
MHFFVSDNGWLPDDVGDRFPCIVLVTDNWDDMFIAETLFHAKYYQRNGEFTVLGDIKIMTTKGGVTRRHLDRYFTQLDETYCALGQDVKFYKKIRETIPAVEQNDIFNALRDAAINSDVAEQFKRNNLFRSSLLRFSDAVKAYKEAAEIFNNQTIEKVLKFNFSCLLKNASNKHVINLDFESSNLPYRINALVGKNATGKTKVLRELSAKMSGLLQPNEDSFIPERPSFSKVIVVSFSAYDDFYKPFDEKEDLGNIFFSYVYCGLKTKDGLLELQGIERNFYESFSRVAFRGYTDKWYDLMLEFFNKDDISLIQEIAEAKANGKDVQYSIDSLLSSGQKVILLSITNIIEHIENDSILFIDEPEIHLHPNAIGKYMKMLYATLEKFNAYAVIATHSPLIIQEIPSRYINVFYRSENSTYINKPYIETFGESISVITSDLFEVREHESNYKTWLSDQINDGKTKGNIMALFVNGLSFNALTYLNNVVRVQREEE